MTIFEIKNEDVNDKALTAKVEATSENTKKGAFAKNIINGKNRSKPGEYNGWISEEGLPQ